VFWGKTWGCFGQQHPDVMGTHYTGVRTSVPM
jgi:hypothetical protein